MYAMIAAAGPFTTCYCCSLSKFWLGYQFRCEGRFEYYSAKDNVLRFVIRPNRLTSKWWDKGLPTPNEVWRATSHITGIDKHAVSATGNLQSAPNVINTFSEAFAPLKVFDSIVNGISDVDTLFLFYV
jgi:hypothetical protein